MAGSGTTALASDVSVPYNTGINIIGTGSVTRGYGQTTFGTNKSVGDIITANDFNNIRYDLLNASAHQDGFGMVVAGYDSPAQERAAQPQHKMLLGVVCYRLQVLRNSVAAVFTDILLPIQVCILYFQVLRMHLIPTISKLKLM